MITQIELALRLPGGELVPVWSGDHGHEVNRRHHDGWGEVVIELLVINMEAS